MRAGRAKGEAKAPNDGTPWRSPGLVYCRRGEAAGWERGAAGRVVGVVEGRVR